MRRPRFVQRGSLLCGLAIATAACVCAEESLPEGRGLAAAYREDAGIGKDAAVLFADSFESGDFKRWDDKSGNLMISAERPHAGSKCAQSVMIRGQNTGG